MYLRRRLMISAQIMNNECQLKNIYEMSILNGICELLDYVD